MRAIALVGAGQTSLQLGCGLLPHGYEVTIYTGEPPRSILEGPVRATAIMYRRALERERSIGLNFWDDEDVWSEFVHVDYCMKPAKRLLVMDGAMQDPVQTLDTRLKYARWMEEFEQRGGRLVVREVSRKDLEDIAGDSDLAIVAAGKQAQDLSLFERDPDRSTHVQPQRKLTLITVAGMGGPHAASRTVTSTLIDRDGEIFRVPFYDKDAGRCVNVLFEARPGKALDQFDGASADDVVRRAQNVVQTVAPWDAETYSDIQLVGPLAWSQGAVTPTARHPVGVLESGRPILGLGDAVIVQDPVGAQGSNTASKMAHFFTQRILERGGGKFDAGWMQQQFDEFWELEGRYAVALSNMMLEPLSPVAREFVLAATRNPAVARVWFHGFDDPRTLFPWVERKRDVHDRIRLVTGDRWWRVVLGAYLGIARHQFASRGRGW